MRSPLDHQVTGRRDFEGHVHFSCSCKWGPGRLGDEEWKAEEIIRHWAVNQPGAGGSLGVQPRFIERELAPAELAAALGAPRSHGRVHLYIAGDQVGIWGLAPFAHRAPVGPDSVGVDGFRASLFITEHEARADESRARREYGVPATPQRAFRVSVPVDDLRLPDLPDWPWGQRRFHAWSFDVEAELLPADLLAATLTRTDQRQLQGQRLDPEGELMIARDSYGDPKPRGRFSLRRRDHRTHSTHARAGRLGAEEAGVEAEGSLANVDELAVSELSPEPEMDDVDDVSAELAADAAAAADCADHAAVYGWLSDGHSTALAEQAAAREVLPNLPAVVQAMVVDLESRKGRPVTLSEVRWLEHGLDGARQEQRKSGPINTPTGSERRSHDDVGVPAGAHQAGTTRGGAGEQCQVKSRPAVVQPPRRGLEVRR